MKLYCEFLSRINDRVAVDFTNNEEDLGWTPKLKQYIGKTGIVVGYYNYNIAIGYDEGNSGYQPGIYSNNGAPIIKWDDGGEEETFSLHHLDFPEIDENRKEERYDPVYRAEFEKKTFLRPLPKLPYMIGMVVETKTKYWDEPAIITRIDFNNINIETCDGSEYPRYTIRGISRQTGSVSVVANDIIRVVDKGNYWAWFNDITKLSFKTIYEEVAFYDSLVKTEQIKNVKTNGYDWFISDALEEIKNGNIDYIKSNPGFFGSPRTISAHKFIGMDELAIRVREKILSDDWSEVISQQNQLEYEFGIE